MTAITTSYPRFDIPWETSFTPVAAGGLYQSGYISGSGIKEILVAVWSEDPSMDVQLVEFTSAGNWNTNQVEIPVAEVAGAAIHQSWQAVGPVTLTSAYFQLWVAYYGTASDFFFDASIRITSQAH